MFAGGYDMELKKVKAILLMLLGIFAVFMMCMAVTRNVLFGYSAIVLVGVYGVLFSIFWRCPVCGKILGPIWVKHCPACGQKVS